MVPCSLPSGFWARMAPAARLVHLTGRNASEADARSFGTPDRPIAIPDARGRACEGLAWSDDDGGSEKEGGEHLAS